MLLGRALKLPIDDMLRLDQGDGCINIIERNGTRVDLAPPELRANPSREPCHHG